MDVDAYKREQVLMVVGIVVEFASVVGLVGLVGWVFVVVGRADVW